MNSGQAKLSWRISRAWRRRPFFAHVQHAALFQFVVVLASENTRRVAVAGKQGEKSIQPFGIEFEAGRQLPEKWPQLFFQRQHAGSEEIGQRNLDLAEPF